jgi:hypothetical protein
VSGQWSAAGSAAQLRHALNDPSLPMRRSKPSAAGLVDKLAEVLPSFQDSTDCSGQEVVFLRKAQALAAALFLRFAESDRRFKFCDVHRLSADSGAVPCCLGARLRWCQQCLRWRPIRQMCHPPGPHRALLIHTSIT